MPTDVPGSLAALIAHGEIIGVSASIHESTRGLELALIQRHIDAPAGRGALFMRMLCAYADHQVQAVTLVVLGFNDRLERYYAQFGFEDDEDSREVDCGDVRLRRVPLLPDHISSP
jgi:predicted GNAT family N-acyltransferase